MKNHEEDFQFRDNDTLSSKQEFEKEKISLESVDCGNIFVSFKKPRTQRDHRMLAFQIIYALDCSDYMITLEELLIEFENSFHLKLIEDSFSINIVNGVIENKSKFDEKLKSYLLNWDYSRLSSSVRIVLYQAFWEMFVFQKTPVKIIIDEYVEVIKHFGENDSFRVVNGVLDKIVKENCSGFLNQDSVFAQVQQH